MPIREFECGTCRKEFNEITSISDPKRLTYRSNNDDYVVTCPHCNEKNPEHLHLKEVPSGTGHGNFHLKGGGWFGKSYKTRY